jgi:photosystem II stability/assembly factor-like uncharacterized protein
MIDARNGWALVAGKGLARTYILRTMDGGITWQDVTPPQLITVRNHTYGFSGSLSVVDANTAWAIANGGEALIGTVWHTDDGGQSWRPGNPIRIYPPGSEMYINGFDTNLNFIDTKNGWLNVRVQGVMAHYIDTWFRTMDGGLNWERIPICRYAADSGCNYLFLDELTGFKNSFDRYISAVSDIETSTIWQIEKTVNGGLTWSNIALPQPADLRSNLFSGETVQPSQVINFSIGQRFTQFPSGAVGVRMDFVAYTANDVFARPSLQKGYYYISNDGGTTWQYFPFYRDLLFLTDLVGWRFMKHVDKYFIEKTVDGGTTWNAVGGEISEVGRLQFTDENSGWMLLQNTDFTSRLMQTIDGGLTWQYAQSASADRIFETAISDITTYLSGTMDCIYGIRVASGIGDRSHLRCESWMGDQPERIYLPYRGRWQFMAGYHSPLWDGQPRTRFFCVGCFARLDSDHASSDLYWGGSSGSLPGLLFESWTSLVHYRRREDMDSGRPVP